MLFSFVDEEVKETKTRSHFFPSSSTEGSLCSFSLFREQLSRLSLQMSDFNPTPFKGEAGVPHVPEDWFTTLFVSTQVRKERKKKGMLTTAIGERQAAAVVVPFLSPHPSLPFLSLPSPLRSPCCSTCSRGGSRDCT